MERKWCTPIAVSMAIFMLLLDITVVNVALPDIQRSLHSSFSDLQWVLTAYALTLAAFLLTASILIIASLVAATAAVFAFALVRSRDFVVYAQPRPAPEAEPVEVAAG